MRLTPILEHLGCCPFQSVNQIAEAVGAAANDVLKAIARLRAIGVPIKIDEMGRWSLCETVRPLDKTKITVSLNKIDRLLEERAVIIEEVDSTNQYLLNFEPKSTIHKRICIAEHMTAGRGRRGSKWFGGAFENIMLSIAWDFRERSNLSGLSLAVAVMVANALADELDLTVQVKWPNDILISNRKVGGILIEVIDSYAIIGIGLNCRLSEPWAESIGQPATSLTAISGTAPDRTQLAIALSNSLNAGLQKFEVYGFRAFKDKWSRLNVLAGRWVRANSSSPAVGRVLGVNSDGHLLLETTNDRIDAISAGSVRPIPAP